MKAKKPKGSIPYRVKLVQYNSILETCSSLLQDLLLNNREKKIADIDENEEDFEMPEKKKVCNDSDNF